MTNYYIIGCLFQSLHLKASLFSSRSWGKRFKKVWCIAMVVFLLPLMIYGCKKDQQASNISHVEQMNNDEKDRICVEQKNLTTMQGVLIKKGATKSYESMVAGETEYYVIGSIILRPSEQVSSSDFEKYKGKKVVVKGFSVKGKPYTPPADSCEQYIIDDDGTPITIPVGAGFKVYEISVVQDDGAIGNNPE